MILEYRTALQQGILEEQRSWKRVPTRGLRKLPCEPLFKIFTGLIGICGELTDGVHWSLVDKNNEFQSPNKFSHASMYGFFALSGLVEVLNFYKLTYFSQELEFITLAVAFGIEGMLFFFHLQGRNMFDVRIHTILFVIIFITAFVILMEACLPKHRRELFMARTVLCLTQGTWFWEIAFTIYGPTSWIRDVETSGKQMMIATEVVTVNVCWHILSWCVVLIICCTITSRLHKRAKLSACCLDESRTECDEGLLNERFCNKGGKLDEEKGLLAKDLECNT